MNALAVPGAYVVGAVPFTQIVALRLVGTDLRAVGTGTVSGTGLYRIAGLWPLIVGGGLDVAKGAAAALLAGSDQTLGVLVSAAVVIGHCWSVFLRGAGGRGISPALGALAVWFWPGALILLAGLALGRLAKETALAALVSDLLLVLVLGAVKGGWGSALGLAVVLPMLVKRVLGNARPGSTRRRVYLNRLLFDADHHPSAPTLDSATLQTSMELLAGRVEHHRQDLNRLNVYPVPDGDTGDNLVAMMKSVTERLAGSDDVAEAIAAGALRGGRGSSGVIFGQALRGFVSDVTPDAPGLAAALTAAATAARGAIADPVEGTILTVSADAARQAQSAAPCGSVIDVAEAAAAEGRRSLARTPELLPALAGLLDAGALGYVLFLDSLVEALGGRAQPPPEITAGEPHACDVSHENGCRYEVLCTLTADRAAVATLRRHWLALGEIVAIGGSDPTWRCHLHTDDVDAALAAARQAGPISEVTVTDLDGQVGGGQ